MNWFKIRVKDGSERGNTYVGSSPDTLEGLARRAASGDYLRLDDMLYYDRGEIKDWAQWDNREEPAVYINPSKIEAIHQFKGDPRTLSRQGA